MQGAEPSIGGNAVVRQPGTPFEDRLARAAAAWAGRGRADELLVTGTAFFAAHLWRFAVEREGRPLDGLTLAYLDASYRGIGGAEGWSAMLLPRVRCACHGERWRVENITVCLGCLRYQCTYAGRECAACGGRIVG